MARKVIPIGIIIVAVGVAFVGYYLLTRQESEFKTYTNEHYGFKFDYPTNWTFTENRVGTTDYFTAYENPENETAIIALTIVDKTIAENQLGLSLDNLASYISSMENIYKNMLIGKPTEIAIDNHQGVIFEIGIGTSPATLIKMEQVVKDRYLYWLEMGAYENYYSAYEPIFDHVIDSFSFLD